MVGWRAWCANVRSIIMKTTLKFAALAVATIGLALPASAQETGVAASLKGKLIGLKDGKIADAEVADKADYYVLYHSASW